MEVKPTASAADIKRAYRKLVQLYHPDKHPGKEFPAARFRELADAYTVLSNPSKRAAYDLQQFRNGIYPAHAGPEIKDAEGLLRIAENLMMKLKQMDSDSVSPGALRAYVALLLSTENLYILRAGQDAAITGRLVNTLLPVFAYLNKEGIVAIAALLGNLPHVGKPDKDGIDNTARQRLHDLHLKRLKPWLIVILATLACGFIFWYGRMSR